MNALNITRFCLPNVGIKGVIVKPVFFVLMILLAFEAQSQTTTQTLTTVSALPQSYIVPAGVTSITVECWGGGGKGGNVNGGNGGGGGGGGAYARKVLSGLTPGSSISYFIGSGGTTLSPNGADTYFSGVGVVMAKGGTAGGNGGNGGAGGLGLGTSVGDVVFAGGAGGNSTTNGGGAGGSSAGSALDGTLGAIAAGNGNITAVTTAPTGGGNGGRGNSTTGNGGNGYDGTVPGGGGGGSDDQTLDIGGSGASGQITITYTLPIATGFAVSSVKSCAGSGAIVTFSSSNLLTDTYTLTYNITGTSNSVASTTATASFIAGSPGSGTFTTSSLGSAENDVLNITRITNSAGNFVSLTSNTGFTVNSCRAWYSYQSGPFNSASTWTLDPSGTTYDNGLNLVPAIYDDITILNGFTVTTNVSNKTLSNTTIQGGGILDLVATTGHNLGVITGTGLLRVQGTTLPSGTFTDFVGVTGGTIEYYNTAGTLSSTQIEYNNLKMTNTTGSIVYVQAGNLVVNGTFDIGSTGAGTVTWQINDNSNTQRIITLNGALNVGTNGRITVGTGNEGTVATPQHSLTMYGNITNNGAIRFYDPTESELNEADYGKTYPATPAGVGVDLHRNELQGNAVNVTFAGTANQTVTCNNTTNFYRLIVDKGTSQQPVLTINSSNTANFRLFGPSNIATTEAGNSWEYTSNNALSIVNGTLELTGSIDIPNICIGGTITDYFPIPRNGALWLNGANVTLQISDLTPDSYTGTKDGRILISGLLRVSAGTLKDGYSKGLGSQDGGSFLQEGGTVNCWQFRPRASGTGVFSFTQTGGTLNVGHGYLLSGGKIDQYEEDYCRFDLRSPNCTFQMSGNAILNVAKPTSGDTGGGLFRVSSTAGNYNVTGGTVNLYTGYKTATNSYPGIINTTAPLYNVSIYEENLTSATSETMQLLSNSLVVLNNLTINTGNDPAFVTNDLNVTVGGNFIINGSTTYTPGNGTTTFNGTGAQAWENYGTITSLNGSVVVNKTSGSVLTLGGTQTFPNISNLTLTSGTLNDGGKTLTVTSTLSNSAIHISTGTGHISSNGPTTLAGNNGTFGTLRIESNSTVTVSGNQTITRNLRLTNTNSSLNIGANSFTVLGIIYTDNAETLQDFSTNAKRIITNGLHNAGGLTRRGAAGALVFPVGTGSVYAPVTIDVAATTQGTITVRPVNSTHPNATTTGESLVYYWRVTSSGYSGISSVTHTYMHNYNDTDVLLAGGNTANYRAARFDATALTWGTSTTTFNASTTTTITAFNTNTGWTGVTGTKLDGEYTAGFQTAFGTVTPYYSKGDGAWNAATGVWTSNPNHITGNVAGPPCSFCPVVIGDGVSINHKINIAANNSSCGTLTLNTGSTLDCSTYTGLNYGTNTSGRGTLRIESATAGTGVFPRGDFLNFLGSNGGTVEWYGATKVLPTTFIASNGSTQNLNTYYNLVLNPSNANTITLPASNLTIYNNVTQGLSPYATYDGTVLTNGLQTVTVNGSLTVEAGTFNFSTANTNAPITLNVTGNIVNKGVFSIVATTTNNQTNTHTINVSGGITNNGTMDLRQYTSGTRYNVADITFNGTSNVVFNGTGSGGTSFDLVTINKGSQAATVTFSTAGTVNTTAVTGGWLKLINGTFDFANTGTVTTILSTNTYTIPSTTKLKVSGVGVTVNTTSTDADANDLFLNGALEIAGGTVNVGNTTVNTNNVDIEYASAGVPSIIVSSGVLWVKSSIRRSTSTITGALAYNQTGGTVTVGGIDSDTSPSNTRGVFEIEQNAGSDFTLTNAAVLNIQRQNTTTACATSYADIYINPVTSNVSGGSTITIGLPTGTTQDNLRVSIEPVIGNFMVQNGGTTNTQTVWLFNDLTLAGTLTIPAMGVLNASCPTPDANITIGGDFNCAGTYTAGTNTTTFNGTNVLPQSATLSTNTQFYDVTISKATGTTLNLSGTAPAAPALNNLEILTGILNIGSIDLTVNRNITVNSSTTGTGSIVVYSTTGISNTITSFGGSFTNLRLGGTATNSTVSVAGNLTINGTLNFATTNRYLMIGGYGLTFSGSALPITGSGSTAFIRTNGVASDAGVIKYWNTGAGQTFAFQIGTATNFTPVTYNLNVTGAGTLTVVPVNSIHPTYNQSGTERILNYYWTVKRSSGLNATASGNHTYLYPASLITGSGGTLSAGYLDPIATTLGWTLTGHGGSAVTTQMTFTSTPTTNLPPAGSYYDYTVGTQGPTVNNLGTLPNPIQPLYSRLGTTAVLVANGGGNWTTNASWTTRTDGDPTNSFPAYTSALSGPRGVPLVILPGARINMDQTGRSSYKITVNGLLYSGTAAGVATTGHNLGIIDGTGTFRTATNTFPAGNYSAFTSSTGGTIEYEINASNSPLTMNSVNLITAPNTVTYNNLTVRLQGVASGTLNMTNDNIIVNGNLTIPTGVTLNNANNRNISIARQWTNNGTFTPGTGTVTFNGSDVSGQTITGATTFYGLAVSKSAGNVTLANAITVSTALTLTNGHIVTTATNILQLSVSATLTGGSANSFVSGPMTKIISPGASFNFPTGSVAANRYRPAQVAAFGSSETWTAQYVGNNPTANGYSNESINTASGLGTVSMYEYWLVSRTGAATGNLTLSYNTGSYRPADGNIGNVSNLRLTRWDAVNSRWDLPPGATTFTQSGTNITGTVTAATITSFSPFTLASLDFGSPLPIELMSFEAKVVGTDVRLNWTTAQEKNNHFFTVEKTVDFESFAKVGIVDSKGDSHNKQSYSLTDYTPYFGKSYYRLKQTDFDGKVTYSAPVMISFNGAGESLSLNAYPNPFNGREISVEITGVSGTEDIPLLIYDQRGIIVYETILPANNTEIVFKDISLHTKLPPGVYIMKAGRTASLIEKIAVK